MNRLERKSWLELAGVAVCMALTGVCVAILVHLDSKGMDRLLIGGTVGLIAGLVVCVRSASAEAKLDEREKAILRKAFAWASKVAIGFWGGSSFVAFFVVGGKGKIEVYFLPLLFVAGLFLAQFVQSAVVLIQSAREENEQ